MILLKKGLNSFFKTYKTKISVNKLISTFPINMINFIKRRKKKKLFDNNSNN